MNESSILFVGEYQLGNLVKNQVKFLYLDLRSIETRRQNQDHFIFQNAQSVTEGTLESVVREQALSIEHPIVLICENGERSMKSAVALEILGYKNVFVLRGGTASLDLAKV